MDNKMYVPKQMKLGQVKRADTYTGKLGFLLPYNEKGKIKSVVSWEKWRDKKIEPIEIENTPIEGFVLNRNQGGKNGWSWNGGREAKIRVWDPRDFEIEITIPNMLYILEQSNSYKGKGLEGTFVYAWRGSTLVLLPTCAEEYRASTEFTDLKYQKISSKEIPLGSTVYSKEQETYIFLGKYLVIRGKEYASNADIGNELVFYSPKDKKFHFLKAANIAKILDPEYSPNYAELVDNFQKSGFIFNNITPEVTAANKITLKKAERYEFGERFELGGGLVFKQNEDGIYIGYRIIQTDTVIYSGNNTRRYPESRKFQKLEISNPYNISLENGNNRILPGKEKTREIKLDELNAMEFCRMFVRIPTARYEKRRRLS